MGASSSLTTRPDRTSVRACGFMLSTAVVNDGLQPSLRAPTDWPREFLRFERCELDVRLDEEDGDHLVGVTVGGRLRNYAFCVIIYAICVSRRRWPPSFRPFGVTCLPRR